MKRIILVFIVMGILSGCDWAPVLQTTVFSDVWEDYTTEISWFRSSNVLQGEVDQSFAEWAKNFEKKRSDFIRINEEGDLNGSTVISGINLSQNVQEYKAALEQLKTIEIRQKEISTLLFKVCTRQKSIVSCY